MPASLMIESVFFVSMTGVGFWGLAYGWWHWRSELTNKAFPFWRQTIATIGLVAVTAQALFFIISWMKGSRHALFRYWVPWVDPTFLLATPCTLAAKGTSRWWLLSSSVLLFLLNFFHVIAD
jgi:hypothetical protein